MAQRLWMLAVIVGIGCTSDKPGVERVILPKKGSKTASENTGNVALDPQRSEPLPTPSAGPTKTPFFGGGESCQSFSSQSISVPYFIPYENSGIMVTRVLNPCVSRNGSPGYERDSPWMAMGFPCTGGSGKMQVIKPFQAPKMVAFVVSTACPMTPVDTEKVKAKVREAVGLGADSKLLAFNPFAVQFWEIDGFDDSDVGETVTLRTTRALNEGWNKFLKNEPFMVKFYGRENAWVQGNNLYQVEAQIKMVNNTAFKLDVVSAKALTPTDVDQLKKKCRALQPRRNCNVILE